MKQILIAKSSVTALNKTASGTLSDANDLSPLVAGGLSFFNLVDNSIITGASTTMRAKSNFGIALGRDNGQLPFIIPEVDLKTLSIVKTLPKKGTHFSVDITLGTTVAGKQYTFQFFKKGVVPHERNSWTVDVIAKTTNASPYSEASALETALKSKISNDFNFTVSRSNGVVTVTAADWTDWVVKANDDATSTMISATQMAPEIGNKEYVEELASKCAAGKGFEDNFAYGPKVNPGYPETVESFTMNTSGGSGAFSTAGYVIYTLRFQVGRDSSKTRDERVWQLVHICVPYDATLIGLIDKILPEGVYENGAAVQDLEARVKALEDA